MSLTETAQEDIRNALQLLAHPSEMHGVDEGWSNAWCEFEHADLEAIRARLESALQKLDAEAVRQLEAFNRKQGETFAERLVREVDAEILGTIHLRAEGDHIVREHPPLGFADVPAEDRALLGQEIDENGE